MAKHVTRVSYKNRASKKRRTIRKLNTTLRRKMQKGGNGSLALLTPMLIIFAALFGSNPAVKGFLDFLLALSGGNSQQGGNKRLKQMGGGRVSDALKAFGDKIKMDQNIHDKTEILGCIDKLTTGDLDSEVDAMNKPSPIDSQIIAVNNEIEKEEEEPQQSGGIGFSGLMDTAKQVASNVKQVASNVKQAASNVNPIEQLKDYVRPKFETAKNYLLSKVDFLQDQSKKECMKKLVNFGFTLMTNRLVNIDVNNAFAALRAKVEAKIRALRLSRSQPISQPIN